MNSTLEIEESTELIYFNMIDHSVQYINNTYESEINASLLERNILQPEDI